ncbi:hypothetical protein G3574_11695 [Noviherbaspirillum sp. 17J57-3]|uniref:Phosphate ABC transporter substrate-binding protein n=2 Tax=Noviherbaspirillum galbum TaxID=2709383 RepID=A0A6B3SLN0_9BURK|nr:hypothetical protein [Noviherbaspirillum galbum]
MLLMLVVLLLAAWCTGARAELAVIVNPQQSVSRMHAGQVAQYFLGGSAALVPIQQAEGSAIWSEFHRKVLDKEPAQVQAIWARLTFTGKARAPREFRSSAEVKKAVSENVNAIGYIDRSELDPSVKAVTILP